MAIDGHGRPTNRLAESWEWDPKGLTLSVHLRPGVRFHDDTPVTAEVVAAILRAGGFDGFEAVKRIEVHDAQTILFRLSRPDGFLPSALANAMIVDSKKPNIGTGPFKLIPQSNPLEAVRNNSYYRGQPGLERIKVIPYATPRASWVGLMKGDVDMALEINRESVEFLEGAARFGIYSSIQPYYIPLVFNFRNPILARPEVRRAISDAIDRDEIVAQGMRGRGQVADDPIWPSHWAYNAAARRHTYNPNAARVRLTLPAFDPPDAARSEGQPISAQVHVLQRRSAFERIALLLQRQLAAVGDLSWRAGRRCDGETTPRRPIRHLFVSADERPRSDLGVSLRHSPSGALGTVRQDTGYNGADAVLDRLRQARQDEDIRIGVGDLRQRFYDDVPAVFLAWTQTTRAVDVRFDLGDRADPEIFANMYANMYKWRLASGETASR